MAEKKKRVPSLSHFPALPVSPSMQQLTSYTTFFLSPEGTTISLHFQRRYFLILAGHPYITRSSKSSWCSVCISRCFLCPSTYFLPKRTDQKQESEKSRIKGKERKIFPFGQYWTHSKSRFSMTFPLVSSSLYSSLSTPFFLPLIMLHNLPNPFS